MHPSFITVKYLFNINRFKLHSKFEKKINNDPDNPELMLMNTPGTIYISNR